MWAAAVTTVAPAAEPVILAKAKEYLRIDDDDTAFDGEITSLIAAARSAIEATTGTRLITQTVEVAADCFSDLDRLPIGPVRQVAKIEYVDAAGDEQEIAGASFETIGSDLEVGIRPVNDGFWPTPSRRRGAITVTLEVGYGAAGTDLPPDLYLVLLQWIRGVFDDRPIDDDTLALRVANHRIWL